MRTMVVRVLVVLVAIAGVNYLLWRWFFSMNWGAAWLSIPLVIAETYSLIDAGLFGLTVWKSTTRARPPAALGDETVDVFITSYNEPISMVVTTTLAALAITHPHRTWVLDDGGREELRLAVEQLGAGYIERGANWVDQPRHAKAGNLNNALMHTSGEFVLILDTDQVPAPQILDRTLGYFSDEKVAVVQTPQYFGNVPDGDPLGSQAPLFYGLIQEGKDGWNAAYFCGSNAILRREAVMELGLVGYARELRHTVDAALTRSSRVIRSAHRDATRASSPLADELVSLDRALRTASLDVKAGKPVDQASFAVQQEARRISQRLVDADLRQLRLDLDEIPGVSVDDWSSHRVSLSADHSPLLAIESVALLLEAVNVDRGDEAQPVMPMSTISVTEDLATAMRLHARGWHSVYHHEILAVGTAPVDLRTMLGQRLRWAQGTMQVFFQENPLVVQGLSLVQRLMYLATMWSYLIGFAALIFLAAPVVFLLFGILPVSSVSLDFVLHFVPYIVLCQLLFIVSARGVPTWRGQQYSFALFPTWITATVSAAANTYCQRPLPFLVTPKDRLISHREWRLVTPQLITIGVLLTAVLVGIARVLFGGAQPLGTIVNIAWVGYDIALMSVVIRAVNVGARLKKEAE